MFRARLVKNISRDLTIPLWRTALTPEVTFPSACGGRWLSRIFLQPSSALVGGFHQTHHVVTLFQILVPKSLISLMIWVEVIGAEGRDELGSIKIGRAESGRSFRGVIAEKLG